MKKVLAVAVLLLLPSVVKAQVFDPNLIYTGGVLYALDNPGPGVSRYQVALTQSLPGIRIAENFLGSTWYTLSPGFSVHTVDALSGSTTGLAIALGGVTVQPKAGKFAIQAGITQDVTGGSQGTHVFLTIGGSLTDYKTIKAKRLAKKAAKKAMLEQGPPAPVS